MIVVVDGDNAVFALHSACQFSGRSQMLQRGSNFPYAESGIGGKILQSGDKLASVDMVTPVFGRFPVCPQKAVEEEHLSLEVFVPFPVKHAAMQQNVSVVHMVFLSLMPVPRKEAPVIRVVVVNVSGGFFHGPFLKAFICQDPAARAADADDLFVRSPFLRGQDSAVRGIAHGFIAGAEPSPEQDRRHAEPLAAEIDLRALHRPAGRCFDEAVIRGADHHVGRDVEMRISLRQDLLDVFEVERLFDLLPGMVWYGNERSAVRMRLRDREPVCRKLMPRASRLHRAVPEVALFRGHKDRAGAYPAVRTGGDDKASLDGRDVRDGHSLQVFPAEVAEVEDRVRVFSLERHVVGDVAAPGERDGLAERVIDRPFRFGGKLAVRAEGNVADDDAGIDDEHALKRFDLARKRWVVIREYLPAERELVPGPAVRRERKERADIVKRVGVGPGDLRSAGVFGEIREV